MGLVSNRPFALAPGMGLNAVVAYQLVIGMGLTWQEAMSVVLVEGLAVTLLVLVGLREAVMNAVPASLKHCDRGRDRLLHLLHWTDQRRTGASSGRVDCGRQRCCDRSTGNAVRLGNVGHAVPVCITIAGLAMMVLLFARGWQFRLAAGDDADHRPGDRGQLADGRDGVWRWGPSFPRPGGRCRTWGFLRCRACRGCPACSPNSAC